MNKSFINVSLRGGGVACSSSSQKQGRNQLHSVIDEDMIQSFISDVSKSSQEINEQSQTIGSKDSQDSIIKQLRWFSQSSQFINQINKSKQKIRENIKMISDNLDLLLDAALNTIQSQRFIALQILKVCNQFSRLIFIYYLNNPKPPLTQEKQQQIQQVLNSIMEFLNLAGESQLYYNSIYYELYVTKICIDTCPNDSKEGQEILINTFKGIAASITEMSPSPELLSALADGAIFLLKENQKRKQKNIFQAIFYLEELKWEVIERIQQGKGINRILSLLGENYKKLVKKSSDWLIKCCWIKIISEIIIYRPIVIKSRIVELINQYKLQADWDQLLNQKILLPLDKNKQIGVIQLCEENSQINRVLQQQIIKFNIVQTTCMKGTSDIPGIDAINKQEKAEDQQQKNQSQDKNMKFIELMQSIPYLQYSNYLQSTAYKCLNLTESIYGLKKLTESSDELDRQYLLGLVEQITYQLEQFTNEYYQVIKINEIVLMQIQNLMQQLQIPTKPINTRFYQIIRWIINYYEIYKQIDFDCGILQDNFKETIKKVNTLEQTEQLYNDLQKIQIKEGEIENLIQQLDLLKQKYENEDLKEFLRYRKILDELTQEAFHTKLSDVIILPQIIQNQKYLSIKSLIQNNKFLNEQIINKIKQIIAEQNIDQMMELYAKLQLLSDIYKELQQLSEETMGSEIQNVLKNDQEMQEIQIVQVFKYAENELQKELNYYLEAANIVYNNWISAYKKESNLQDEVLEQLESIDVLFQYWLNKFDGYQLQIRTQIASIQQQLTKSEEENYFQQKLSQITLNYQELMQDNLEQSQFYQLLNSRITQLNDIFDQLDIKLKNQLGPDIENLLIIQDNYQKQWCSIKIDQIKEQLLNNQNIINQLRDQDILIKSQVVVDSKKELVNGHLQVYQQIQSYIQKLQILQNHKQYIKILEDINIKINDLKIQKYLKVYDDKEQLFKKLYDINRFIETNFKIDVQEFQKIFDKKPDQQLQQSNTFANQEIIQIIIKPYKDLQNMQQQKDNAESGRNAGALQKVKDIYQNEFWRIKDYTYLCWLQILPYLQQDNQKIIGQLLILARFKETDFRIVATLKNKEQIQQMEALINNQWEESEEQVKVELQNTLNQLQAIQLQLQSEERKEVRDQLLQQHKEIESQLEQQLKNVNEIGDILGITINFMKDIKKDLQAIQSKLDNIINSLDQIGQDLKFLRGKTPQQLIEIRMQNILLNKMIQDSSSVYVQIRTKEYNLKENKEEYQETPLFNFDKIKNGEVDEFLNEQKKISLLIHGAAGSGKSLTSRKIEEYLWTLYKQSCNSQLWKDVKDSILVPIFIQLPTLKEPKFQAIEETLQSSLYRFDQKQIEQLRESVQNGAIKLIFIMDSYDELAQEFQGTNLIQTNKLHLWKQQGQKHPRVISTSRTEAFTTPDYRQWFYENDQNGIESFKEIRLLAFDDSQRLEFLLQFSQLKLKINIYELLTIISKTQQNQQIIQDTTLIWEQIQQIIQYNQNNKSSFLLNEQMAQKIIEIIKKNPNVIQLNQEQEVSFKKQISTIWNQQQYYTCINQMGLVEILETPFMMNIVVEVLPQMNNEIAQPNTIKQYFFKNYLKLKQDYIDSILKLANYKSCYITSKYSDEQIQQLRNLKEAQIKQQSIIIWDNLTEANFFSQWNYQQQFDELIILMKKSQTLNKYDDDELFIIVQALKSHKLTIYNFFQCFFQQYIELQRQKLIYSNDIMNQSQFENDIQQYSVNLAELMMMRQETIIQIKQKGILFRENTHDPYQQYFEDQDKYGKYRQLIRKCMPLRQKGDYFSFNHKSIQEYLFSKHILDLFYSILEQKQNFVEFINTYRDMNKQIDIKDLVIPEQQQEQFIKIQKKQTKEDIVQKLIDKILHSSLNQINLNDTFYKGTLKFLRIQFKEISELMDILDVTILLSSICSELIQFSSNSLLIIIGIKQNLFGKNYSKVKIENLSLDGISFINCNLSDTQFSRISINGINLYQSNLTNINWDNVFSSDLPNLQLPSAISKIDVSPTEDRIVSCSNDKKLIIWDSKTFQKIREIEPHSQQTLFVKYSNNGKLLYTYARDKLIKIWNSQDLTQICEESADGFISGMGSFSSDDKFIAICQQKGYNPVITIREVQKLSLIKELEFEQYEAKAIQYHSDNTVYAIMDKYEKPAICIVLSVETGEVKLKFELGTAMRHAFISPDCSFLVLTSLYVGNKWNIANQQLIASYKNGHTREIYYADFTQDGNTIITCGEDKTIVIWDAKSGNQLTTLIGHTNYVIQVKVTKDQKMIISAGTDGQIKIWDASVAKRSSQSQNLALKEIKSIVYSIDGKLIGIGSFGYQIVIYDSQTYEVFQTITTIKQYTEGLSFHPNNRYLIYGSEGSYYIWDFIEKKQIYQGSYPSQIYATKYSILGNYYFIQNAAFGTTYLTVYSTQTNQKVNQFDGLNYDFNTFWSSKIENQIITQKSDKTMVTNCQTGETKAIIQHKESIGSYSLSYDSNYYVCTKSQKMIEVWDLNTASLIKSFKTNVENSIKVAISPNAEFVVVSFQDKTVRVFEVATGQQVGQSLIGHLADVKWLLFNPNGEQFISSAENFTTVIWNKNNLFKQKQNLYFDPDTIFIEGAMIPQQTSHKTLIGGCLVKNSQIKSHIGFELIKIWKEKQQPASQQQK